jgi:hypothetical protein
MLAIDTTPGISQAKIAENLNWVGSHGRPDKAKVNRVLVSLCNARLADKDLHSKYHPTDRGKKEAARLRKST